MGEIMKASELREIRRNYLIRYHHYKMLHWTKFNYNVLNNIMYKRRTGRGQNEKYNDCIIMADTETSKKLNSEENHIVAWTISIRAFDMNLVTLYGQKPSEFCDCIEKIMDNMEGDETYIYFHNLSYDIVFLEKFLFKKFGYPINQLNTKPHYPILLKWDNGLVIKDSLILAQRKLEKWAIDLDVEHKKAVGKWNYDKIRNQCDELTSDELKYIENDTLAGVECIQKTLDALNKNISSIPYTATGIPREQVRKRAKQNNGRNEFKRRVATYDQYRKLEYCFHGGYTHANRYYIDMLIDEMVQCFDFASSYPYCMLSQKFPSDRFVERDDCTPEYIVENSDTYAYMFKFIAIKIELKDKLFPMPPLQFSKCVKNINAIVDNGRILQSQYVEIYLTEMDLKVIEKYYKWEKALCTEVEFSTKDYLSRWLTDYVFECFYNKTMAKGGDPVDYSIKKATVNSIYGLTVQKNIRENWMQNFETMEYYIDDTADSETAYNKFVNNQGSVLPYQYGVWVTSYAFYHLFLLGECCENWIYSDTDSCYGIGWDYDKVNSYNEKCKKMLQDNGYGAVIRNGEEYWLGVAETEGDNDKYSEFKVMGAKRYCGRCMEDNEIHITVAGVPKKTGAKCLNNDINNFTNGFIFSGAKTGKLLHKYFYVDDIYIDDNGNETGDSIDLSPCDYLLDSVNLETFESFFESEVEIQVYDEE